MARGDSTIRVNVIGDAKSLQRAASDSDKAVGRIGTKAVAVGNLLSDAFAGGTDAVFDFAQSALAESDRVGDATLRLQEQLGDLSQPIIDAADEFSNLGQSEGDMLELQARIADMGTAAGIADAKLAPMANSVGQTAAALALIGDTDAATIVELIGKAALGSERPLKDLGINLSDAEVEARALRDRSGEMAGELTEGELSAARLSIILEKLAPRVEAVTGAEADLELRQATLDAKFETFTGKVGAAVEGPLTDLLEWILAGIDGMEKLAAAIDGVPVALQNVESAALDVIDVLAKLLTLFAKIPGGFSVPDLPVRGQVGGTVAPGGGGPPSGGITVQVQGGSQQEIENAVVDAVTRLRRQQALE